MAFANRGKKLRVNNGFGTIRYSETSDDGMPDRAGALAEITRAKREMTS